MIPRILLVEDEPGLVLTLSDLLTAEGYAVESAGDGVSGLARAAEEPFDLLVLDIMLPGKSGFEVCRELRQRGNDIAILMLTARSQLTDRVVGLKLGADDYLTKPFEPPELLARIEALLRRTKKSNLSPVVQFQFANVAVRRAFAHAIDSEAILRNIYFGYGAVSNTPIPPVMSEFSTTGTLDATLDFGFFQAARAHGWSVPDRLVPEEGYYLVPSS